MKKMFLRIPAMVLACMGGLVSMGALSALHAEDSHSDSGQESLVGLQVGWVDAVSEHEVVINDMATPLAAITLYDQHGFLLDKRSLVAGQNVSYVSRSGGVEIHMLNEKLRRRESADPVRQPGETKAKKETLRQVDGVWKN